MTIGVDRVANSGLNHSRFSPSGDQLSTIPVSREIPFISGPRQNGQSNGSGSAAVAPDAVTTIVRAARSEDRKAENLMAVTFRAERISPGKISTDLRLPCQLERDSKSCRAGLNDKSGLRGDSGQGG